MKIQVVLLVAIVVLSFCDANAQEVKEIESRFGQSESVYAISDTLWITPSFGADGQFCRMQLYPKVMSSRSNLNLEEVLKFINEFIPVSTRGRRGELFGSSIIGGHVIQTYYEYENVVFVFGSTFQFTELPKSDEFGEIGFSFEIPSEASLAEYRRKEAMKSDDQLIREHAFKTEALGIYWPQRKCIEK